MMWGMDRSDRQRIGRLIKTARFEQGMTQADLAGRTGRFSRESHEARPSGGRRNGPQWRR
jgi:transcriptional regulator with XRE-family HTH domain